MSDFTNLTEASYVVQLQDRVTGDPVPGCSFDVGEGQFSRLLDGISSAEFSIPGGSCGCDCVPTSRSQELAFYRDDSPEEPAWIGPVVRVVDDEAAGTIRINAFDRLYWVEGAPASRDIIYKIIEIDIVEVFAELLRDAEIYEDPNLGWFYKSSFGQLPPDGDLLVQSGVLKGESLWSAIAGYAKSALDFTVVGPHLYWGSPEVPIGDGPTLTSDSWTTPPIIDRDFGTVSRVQVSASNNIVAVCPEGDEEPLASGDGKRTLFLQDTLLNTLEEAKARACEVYAQNSRASDFIITGDGSLSPAFPHGLRGLVPGRNYRVEASGQCLESEEDLLQLFNVVVRIGSKADPSRQLRELSVAADFRRPGTEGAAERQSA